jgi:hypothetical protein
MLTTVNMHISQSTSKQVKVVPLMKSLLICGFMGMFSETFLNMVLVQKLQFTCKQSLKLGYTDTITLKKVCDWYGKPTFIQVETLSA